MSVRERRLAIYRTTRLTAVVYEPLSAAGADRVSIYPLLDDRNAGTGNDTIDFASCNAVEIARKDARASR